MTLHRLIRSAIVILVMTMITLPVSPLRADTNGTIGGRIVSGTDSANISALQTVRLDGYRQTTTLSARATSTSSDGSFEFQNVEGGSEFVYLVSVEYGGIRYSSDILLLEPG